MNFWEPKNLFERVMLGAIVWTSGLIEFASWVLMLPLRIVMWMYREITK